MMPRHSGHVVSRIAERMAKLSPPRHRDLVQGMLAERNSLADPAERRRFEVGAIAAIARLALGGHLRSVVDAPGAFIGAREADHETESGGTPMPQLTTRQVLRRHAVPFLLSLATLTGVLVVNYAAKQLPTFSARELTAGEILEVSLLALPFTLALTIPMAVFVAVSWVFTGLGAEGILDAARRERHGVRRLVAPVLCAAAVVATLTFISNTQVLPRANARLVAVLNDAPRPPGERSMKMFELKAAASTARAETGAGAARSAARYEVEIQKKFALAAACLFLALAGMATVIRFPHGGAWLVIGASLFVFTVYYVSLTAGESLADRQVISPLAGMWMANAFLLAVGLLLVRRPSGSWNGSGPQTLERLADEIAHFCDKAS